MGTELFFRDFIMMVLSVIFETVCYECNSSLYSSSSWNASLGISIRSCLLNVLNSACCRLFLGTVFKTGDSIYGNLKVIDFLESLYGLHQFVAKSVR